MPDEGNVPSTMLSSSTLVGRIYGQGIEDECLFDVDVDHAGRPFIKVRARDRYTTTARMPMGSCLLVQLFEQPEFLWLAQPVMLNDETPMIAYAPIEPLVSADGRCQIPELQEVTTSQHREGVDDREHQDGAQRRENDKHYALPGG